VLTLREFAYSCRVLARSSEIKRVVGNLEVGPANRVRSYWIPGSYAPALSEMRNSFLRLLKTKGFKEQSMTKVGLYAIGKSTPPESNKSLSSFESPSLASALADATAFAPQQVQRRSG
jgi:hypothetical protein